MWDVLWTRLHCASPEHPAGLITLTVGYAGWVIARHQANVAQAKLKLDLFEKRYPIFLQTWQIMSEVTLKGTRERNYGLGNPFSNFMPQAGFLFGEQVEQYLSDAATKWIRLNALEAEIPDGTPRPPGIVQERRELKEWFEAQAKGGVKELFAPYLDFEKWK
jgi:hypothetical protein